MFVLEIQSPNVVSDAERLLNELLEVEDEEGDILLDENVLSDEDLARRWTCNAASDFIFVVTNRRAHNVLNTHF